MKDALPNISHSQRLRFTEVKVLADKTLIKFAGKVAASPIFSSLLTPVLGLHLSTGRTEPPAQPLQCFVQHRVRSSLICPSNTRPAVLPASFVVETVACG